MEYKLCVVPQCTNTSINSPQKLFVSVPTNHKRRKMWLQLARRDPNAIQSHSNVFICEDHFDNNSSLGFQIISKFHCQEDRKRLISDAGFSREVFLKRQRIDLITECLQSQSATETHTESSLKDDDMVQEIIEPEEPSTSEPPHLLEYDSCTKKAKVLQSHKSKKISDSEIEDSGGEAVFSWQRDEELIEADDDEPPAPSTLALLCESDPDPGDPAHAAAGADPGPEFDPDPEVVFNPQPDQAVPSVSAPVDNRCKDCGEVNEGFVFWCVQCEGGALCGACAGRAPHHAHYVLRAPMGCSRARTQVVLTMIRQQLLQNQNLSRHGTVDDFPKLEVKEEPAEIPHAESSAAEPDPLACEPMGSREMSLDYTLEPEFPHDLIEPLEPVSLRSPISLHLPRSSSRWPHSLSSCPASPPEPAVTPERATQEADKSIEEIVAYNETLQPPRPRKPIDAHEEILIPSQCKLVSPAEVKRAFLSRIERVVTTKNKQLKVYQPILELTQDRENVVTTQHKEPIYEGNSRTTRLQARGQATMKVTSEPQTSEFVHLDVADETVEYLEEGLDSDIETVDNVDNHGDDVLDEDDFDDDVLDEDYLLDEGDLEEAELEEDNVSDEEIIVRNVPGRGVKRKKDAEETLPVKGPSESMVRALPTKGESGF